MVSNLQIGRSFEIEMTRKNYQHYDLVQGLKEGDRIAQNNCYKTFYGRMKAVVLRYTASKEDSEEIVNTAFLKAFSSIQNYSGSGSFEGWLRTIVKRTTIDHCRKFLYNKAQVHEILDFDVLVYNKAINNLEAEDFMNLIERVPAASRTVFNLFAIEGYSHREIGEMLQITEGTSKWHLSNARKKLTQIIHQENLVG